MKKSEIKFEHTIPAVEKTLQLLRSLAVCPEETRQSDLAKKLGITQSTCYRIVQTLRKYAWAEKRADGSIVLGSGALPLALRLAKQTIRWDQAQNVLEHLAQKTSLACKLSIRQGAEQLVAARAESPGPFGISGKKGARFPVIEGSVGAALLADADAKELDQLVAECAEEIPETHEPRLLAKAVAFVHQHGYALNTVKNRWRIGALSVPIRDARGCVAGALTLLGMPDDFTKKRIKSLLDAMAEAQTRLRPD